MFFSNGYVYGGEPKESIKIESVKILDDMMMLVRFNNGETRLFDATILKGEVFRPLKESNIFAGCTIEHGVPTWADGEIDCAPEFIYFNSFEYDTTGLGTHESASYAQR